MVKLWIPHSLLSMHLMLSLRCFVNFWDGWQSNCLEYISSISLESHEFSPPKPLPQLFTFRKDEGEGERRPGRKLPSAPQPCLSSRRRRRVRMETPKKHLRNSSLRLPLIYLALQWDWWDSSYRHWHAGVDLGCIRGGGEENMKGTSTQKEQLEGQNIVSRFPNWKGTLEVTLSQKEQLEGQNIVSRFPNWKGTLEVTLSHFLQWNGTLEGTLSYFLHCKGALECTLYITYNCWHEWMDNISHCDKHW